MMLRLLASTLVSQKIDSVHFYSCPQAKTILTITRRQNEIIHLSQTVVYEDLFFTSRKGKDYGAEKMTKLKTVRVLVTCFDKFHHLFKL